MKDRFGARKAESMTLRFHTQTGGVTLTAQQPDNNVVRVTLQALAAVLGGTQSLHTNSKDEALALPAEESVRLALRTQQVIAHESGIASTVDPLGGSFYLEHLTDTIESEADALIKSIDAKGGIAAAIESGFVRGLIDQAAYEWSSQIERKDRIVVGVNEYTEDEPLRMHLFEVGEEIQAREIASLNQVRARRDQRAVERCPGRSSPGCRRTTATTSCRRSWKPCGPMPRSARFAVFSVRFSANIRKPTDREWCRRHPRR